MTTARIFQFIGQSNADGRGDTEPYVTPDDANMLIAEWDTYPSYTVSLSAITDPTGTSVGSYADCDASLSKASPCVAFCNKIRLYYPDDVIVIINSAKGGTASAEWVKGQNCYDDAIAKLSATITAVTNAGYVPVFGGWINYQGERDAAVSVSEATYVSNWQSIQSDLRSDSGYTNAPISHTIIAGFGNGSNDDWNTIRSAIQSLEDTEDGIYSRSFLIGFGYNAPNDPHVDTYGLQRCGEQHADVVAYHNNIVEAAGGLRYNSSTVKNDRLNVDIVLERIGGSSLAENDTNLTGFSFTDNGNTVTPTSILPVGINTIRATFSTILAGEVKCSFCDLKNPDISNMPLTDSNWYLEPFLEQSASSPDTVFLGSGTGRVGTHVDTYVQSFNNDSCYGEIGIIWTTTGNRQALLAIDLRDLIPYKTRTMISATLNVYSYNATDAGILSFRELINTINLSQPTEDPATQGQATYRRRIDYNGGGGDVTWISGNISSDDYYSTVLASAEINAEPIGTLKQFDLTERISEAVLNDVNYLYLHGICTSGTSFRFYSINETDETLRWFITVVFEEAAASETDSDFNNIVRAVTIYLDDSYSEKRDIGLYEVSGGNSELRFIESDISGYSPSKLFKTGILTSEWYDGFTDGYDGTYGGTIGEIGIGAINIVSSVVYESAQRVYFSVLSELGIRINGNRIDIIEFEIVDGALISIDGTVIFRGECSDIQYNEYMTKISYQTAMLNRKSNIGTIINETDHTNASPDIINKMIPVTFGTYEVEKDTYTGIIKNGMARFQRIADKERILSNAYFDDFGRENGLKLFPVMDMISDLTYSIIIDGNVSGFSFDSSAGIYVRVVEGQNSDDTPRKVHNIVDAGVGVNRLNFTVESYFKQDLDHVGSSEDGRSWVEFVIMNQEYQSDVWPCSAFLNENGEETTVPELYSFDEDEDIFTRIAEYGYQIDTGTSDKNKLKIYPMHFSGSKDSMAGYIIKALTDVYKMDSRYLSEWWNDDYPEHIDQYEKVKNGWYALIGSWYQNIIELAEGGFANLFDKDSTTYYYMRIQASNPPQNIRYARVLGFTLPIINENFSFDGCFFGIKSLVVDSTPYTDTYRNIHYFFVLLRRFAYNAYYPFDEKRISAEYNDEATIDCMPDFYFDDEPSTNDKNFFRESENEKLFAGYTTFDMDVSDVDHYNSIKEGAIVLRQADNIGSGICYNEFRIYELAIIYTRSISVKSHIYSPYKGRVFDSTFNSQVATDLIDNPKLLLLHILMLQNWSESEEDVEWGKEYPATPLIDISTNEGGLNYSELDFLEDIKIRGQLLEYNNAWTDSIIESICNDFFLVPFQRQSTGYEGISFIGKKYSTSPSTTITLNDIIGEISDIVIQPERGIFCEPIVRYNYNITSGKYDGLIQITNSSQSTFSSDYVLGLTGDIAENVWNKAHKLWTVCNKIEEAPEQYTDKKWIYRDEDALWYLLTWLYYMGAVDTETGVGYASRNTLSFNVHHDTGKYLFKGQHINIDLPFHTEDVSIQAIIENTTKQYEEVNVQVMLLDNITEESFCIQKVIPEFGTDDDIEKVIPEFGDEDDWEKVI